MKVKDSALLCDIRLPERHAHIRRRGGSLHPAPTCLPCKPNRPHPPPSWVTEHIQKGAVTVETGVRRVISIPREPSTSRAFEPVAPGRRKKEKILDVSRCCRQINSRNTFNFYRGDYHTLVDLQYAHPRPWIFCIATSNPEHVHFPITDRALWSGTRRHAVFF